MRRRRTLGTGRLPGGGGPRQAQGGAAALAPSPVRSAGVHAEVVGDPRDGRADGSRRLHPRPRPAGVDAARGAVALVGPRVGGRRAGTVADAMSIGVAVRKRRALAFVSIARVVSN